MAESTDREGRTALHYAALEGRCEAVRELIATGLDPNVRDRQGFTPLHFAAQEQHAEVVGLLVHAGADPAIRDTSGNAPLWQAVFNSRGQGATITALLAGGADPDVANNHGRTPRSLAQQIGNFDVARFLPDPGR